MSSIDSQRKGKCAVISTSTRQVNIFTFIVNFNRVEVLWRPVTNHLLEVSSHPLNRMREWGIEAITTLVRSAIQYQHSTSLKENQVNTISYRVFFLLNLLEHF